MSTIQNYGGKCRFFFAFRARGAEKKRDRERDSFPGDQGVSLFIQQRGSCLIYRAKCGVRFYSFHCVWGAWRGERRSGGGGGGGGGDCLWCVVCGGDYRECVR